MAWRGTPNSSRNCLGSIDHNAATIGEPVDDMMLCVIVSTETYTLHRDSSTELCTGATAHTHEDENHHRGRCRPVKDQSPGMAQT